MEVNLDKKALISLVSGENPYYSIFENDLVKDCGWYSENRGWTWYSHELEKYTEEQLYELYLLCRNSWNNEND